jgi:hypothetical protein
MLLCSFEIRIDDMLSIESFPTFLTNFSVAMFSQWLGGVALELDSMSEVNARLLEQRSSM